MILMMPCTVGRHPWAWQGCDQGWRLLVAIADVSHYVENGSAIDVDAMTGATRCLSSFHGVSCRCCLRNCLTAYVH